MATPLSPHLAPIEAVLLFLPKFDVHVRKGRSTRNILLMSVVPDIDLVVGTYAAILLLNAHMLTMSSPPPGGQETYPFLNIFVHMKTPLFLT